MTPGVAVGMDTSIRACILEKNRWIGKAMFTASHESAQIKPDRGPRQYRYD